MTTIKVKTGRAFSGCSQWGYTARVDADGTVRVWDSVAGYYTTCHSLSAAQQAYVRSRIASPVTGGSTESQPEHCEHCGFSLEIGGHNPRTRCSGRY